MWATIVGTAMHLVEVGYLGYDGLVTSKLCGNVGYVLQTCGFFVLDVGMLVLWLVFELAKLFCLWSRAKRKLVEDGTLFISGSSLVNL